jgi:hypothetical protein
MIDINTDNTKLFEHAQITAQQLGHAHRLSRKEWDQSNPPLVGQAVVARFGTWKEFISSAGLDAESRADEKRMNRIFELLNECLSQLVSEACISDEERASMHEAVWFDLTGVR